MIEGGFVWNSQLSDNERSRAAWDMSFTAHAVVGYCKVAGGEGARAAL